MKRKPLLGAVIICIIAISVFSITTSMINADSTEPVISVVLSGTTSTTQLPSVAVGSTFSVDIRIDNTGSVTTGVNGYTFTVTWNPAILNCTDFTDPGPFLISGKGASGSVTSIANGPNNAAGTLTLNDIIINTVNLTAAATGSGVLSTIVFIVDATGQSDISLSPSSAGQSYLVTPDGQGDSNPVDATAVNAVYGSASTTPIPTTSPTPTPTPTTSPTPTPTPTTSPMPTPTASPSPSSTPTPTPSPTGTIYGPTAAMTLQNGTSYTVNSTIVLDGSPSTPGYDTKTCPITNYVWVVQFPNDTQYGVYSGKAVQFTVPFITSLKVMLIVTAPDVANPANTAYSNTSATLVSLNVIAASQTTQMANIDVFTNKGGQGQNATSPGYIPQELVLLYAYVTYQGAPVGNKEVVFTVIDPHQNIISVMSALTNETGYASTQYRTPWFNNGTTDFGIWQVLASVDISQVVVSDTVYFMYNYPVIISSTGISIPSTVARGTLMNITVTVQDIINTTPWAELTITIYDNESVPIDNVIIHSSSVTNNIASTTVTIPTWAFVGTATVYVNILSADPLAGGVPLCPEQSASFQITT